MYYYPPLAKSGFGEGIQNGSVIVVKTHESGSNQFDRVVLLVRDPFAAIFAEFNRR